jgi:cathepsin H
MKAACVALLLTASNALSTHDKWTHVLEGSVDIQEHEYELIYNDFVSEYKHRALQASRTDRFETFKQNVQEIIAHNTAEEEANWKMGISEFADYTDDEFKHHYLQKKQFVNCTSPAEKEKHSLALKLKDLKHQEHTDIPESHNWVDLGAVSPVKNQGHCGSCWTFATMATIESRQLIKYNNYYNMSEQQVVDCANDFGDNKGCDGGLPSQAYEYLRYAGGAMTEAEYPYTATTDECSFKREEAAVEVIGGSVNITYLDEYSLQKATYETGPIAISFEVIPSFKHYKSGVYHNDTCSSKAIKTNHAVTVVGYGTENGMDYWFVKNSWGAAWGDQGFFKMQRGINMCGIADCNAYPYDVKQIADFKGPAPFTVNPKDIYDSAKTPAPELVQE